MLDNGRLSWRLVWFPKSAPAQARLQWKVVVYYIMWRELWTPNHQYIHICCHIYSNSVCFIVLCNATYVLRVMEGYRDSMYLNMTHSLCDNSADQEWTWACLSMNAYRSCVWVCSFYQLIRQWYVMTNDKTRLASVASVGNEHAQ